MKQIINKPLQTVKVSIPQNDNKTKTESSQPKEVVKEMKILTE